MVIQYFQEDYSLKNNIWIKKNIRCDTVEIIVRDENKRKLERWLLNIRDKKRTRQIVSSLKTSYGIDLGSSVNEDLKWLMNR